MSNATNTLRLVSPLFPHLYRKNEYGDLENKPEDLPPLGLLPYQEQIRAAIASNRSLSDNPRGLAEFLHDAALQQKIISIGAIGSLVVLLFPGNMGAVLGGLVIKSFGALPIYVMTAQLAESLDHIEWKNNFRADGFSASVYSIICTVAAGIGQSILLAGISAFDYISPGSTTEIINQPEAVKTFFNWCFVGVPMIGYLIGSLLMRRFDVEQKIPQISADLTARRKAAAEARGEVYISTEEKAARR